MVQSMPVCSPPQALGELNFYLKGPLLLGLFLNNV